MLEEGAVKRTIAYLILAHAADAQLWLLIDTLLADPRSRVYLHLDRKCRDLGWLRGFEDPRFRLHRCYKVHWGAFSIVATTRLLLADAFADPANTRFVLLSGTCFPLCPAAEVNDRLLALPGPVFSLWGKVDPASPEESGLGGQAIAKMHLNEIPLFNLKAGPIGRRGSDLLRVINRAIPYRRRVPPGTIWKGSQFFVADRDFAAHAVAPHPALDRLFRYAAAPDEMYFATLYGRQREAAGEPIALTPEGAERQGLHFVRKVFRPRRRTFRQKLTEVIDLRRLALSDIPDALASGALFTRKCDLAIATALLDRFPANARPSAETRTPIAS